MQNVVYYRGKPLNIDQLVYKGKADPDPTNARLALLLQAQCPGILPKEVDQVGQVIRRTVTDYPKDRTIVVFVTDRAISQPGGYFDSHQVELTNVTVEFTIQMLVG